MEIPLAVQHLWVEMTTHLSVCYTEMATTGPSPARVPLEISLGEWSICPLLPGRPQLVPMDRLGSAPMFELHRIEEAHVGPPGSGSGFRMWQQKQILPSLYPVPPTLQLLTSYLWLLLL